MKFPKGSKVLVSFLILGLAILAGGQFWAVTRSLLVGVGIGGAVCIFLAWFAWSWARPRARRRFLGEFHGGVFEGDFGRAVSQGQMSKERVGRKVKTQPRDIAGSVRAMLVKDKPYDK